MPEQTEQVDVAKSTNKKPTQNKAIDLEALAEKIAEHLLREMEIERQRSGKSY